MSKLWKRPGTSSQTERAEITYIDNEFLTSVGSVAKCSEPNCNRSTRKIRNCFETEKYKEAGKWMWRCEICAAEGKGRFCWNETSVRYLVNDSTFKCPASECTAVNQSFQDFVNRLCCKETQRQTQDFEKYKSMRIRDKEYRLTYEEKETTKRKIEEEKQSAKKAKEAIEENQQKLKEAERNVKNLENRFVKLQKLVDAKKRGLEEEIVVVAAPKQLAIKAKGDAVKNNNNAVTAQVVSAIKEVSAIKAEASTLNPQAAK